MLKKIKYIQIILLVALISACGTTMSTAAVEDRTISLIPIPVSATFNETYFQLSKKTKIYIDPSSDTLEFTADYLSEIIDRSTGFKVPVLKELNSEIPGIFFVIVSDSDLAEEGYNLEITEDMKNNLIHTRNNFSFSSQRN